MSGPRFIGYQPQLLDFSLLASQGPGSSASRSSGSRSAGTGKPYERKGYAAWWRDEQRQDDTARARAQQALMEGDREAAVKAIQEVNSSRDVNLNAHREQVQKNLDAYAKHARDKDLLEEMYITGSGQVPTHPETGDPITVSQALDLGMNTPLGLQMDWNVPSYSYRNLRKRWDDQFKGLGSSKTVLDEEDFQGMTGEGQMIAIVGNKTAYTGNEQQLAYARMKMKNEMSQTDRLSLMSGYLQSPQFNNLRNVPVDKGGLMGANGQIDPSALSDRMFGSDTERGWVDDQLELAAAPWLKRSQEEQKRVSSRNKPSVSYEKDLGNLMANGVIMQPRRKPTGVPVMTTDRTGKTTVREYIDNESVVVDFSYDKVNKLNEVLGLRSQKDKPGQTRVAPLKNIPTNIVSMDGQLMKTDTDIFGTNAVLLNIDPVGMIQTKIGQVNHPEYGPIGVAVDSGGGVREPMPYDPGKGYNVIPNVGRHHGPSRSMYIRGTVGVPKDEFDEETFYFPEGGAGTRTGPSPEQRALYEAEWKKANPNKPTTISRGGPQSFAERTPNPEMLTYIDRRFKADFADRFNRDDYTEAVSKGPGLKAIQGKDLDIDAYNQMFNEGHMTVRELTEAELQMTSEGFLGSPLVEGEYVTMDVMIELTPALMEQLGMEVPEGYNSIQEVFSNFEPDTQQQVTEGAVVRDVITGLSSR